MLDLLGNPQQLAAIVIALVVGLTVHEFAHAWTAYRLGDPTAKYQGRLTLNPLKHLDVLGTLMILMVGFGWAKPVPVNPTRLRYGRAGLALVAAAGPLSNLVMAALAAFAWGLSGYAGSEIIWIILRVFVWLNVILVFFNLIPIAPLDGFKVAIGWLPEPLASIYAQTAAYGPLLLFGLIILGTMVPQFDLLSQLIVGPTQTVVSALLPGF